MQSPAVGRAVAAELLTGSAPFDLARRTGSTVSKPAPSSRRRSCSERRSRRVIRVSMEIGPGHRGTAGSFPPAVHADARVLPQSEPGGSSNLAGEKRLIVSGHDANMATDLRRPPAALDSGSFDGLLPRHQARSTASYSTTSGIAPTPRRSLRRRSSTPSARFGAATSPSMPRAWMYGIARNATRRRYRTLSRRPREVELDAAARGRSYPNTTRGALGRHGPGRVRRSSGRSHREVRLSCGRSKAFHTREIAARLELSQSAVETLLFRARRSLREHLEDEGVRPAVQGRLTSLKSLALLPAAFLGRLSDRMQHFVTPELATKAAGAVTAVALGTGVAVGTQVASGEASTKPDTGARSAPLHLRRGSPDSAVVARPRELPCESQERGILSAWQGRPK